MLLAIETSCDETSVAVVHDGTVSANIVTSQVHLHAEYGGVVPELASREHLRNLLPVARAALAHVNIQPDQICAVAATRGPGLPAALRIGFTSAQAFAFALNLPIYGVHHHEAHLYSPWIAGSPLRAQFEDFEPNISLIVSGGHTMLVQVESEQSYQVLGATLDDAAGECFDKTAKILGLPYPGGPLVDRLAAEGNPNAFEFPRPLLHDNNDDFSFSGLKTSVRYFLQKRPGLADDPQALRDLCASAQAAIVEVLAVKAVRAAHRLGVRCVTASGGVTCNSGLRRELELGCARGGLRLRLADRAVCTDNAAMIGIRAERQLRAGVASTPFDVEVMPGWPLG
ncbi:MAG TPA: tRNA (adenosine(37)-N6)-threonylcarbamoyltransferase complex transferase subunit TsaD [Verrucomicrobiota bacterium]|nr:tRNA (adenosine(37)-N6)-threonylcarbamoyltransferase complex transferase subunit TsaD [Verrucomicrobiales bacterium]HRI11495.1 tRNA (adenosine(37)-N6)-threonylcarbamoyltransferase complex transferase subunit TsaD [Verrucomicrobiota bacterium]